jgi:hypothetical protein
MKAAGENFAEIWTAAWSLGLEWNAGWRGYHGVGQYNLVHAWELDRVLDAADENGIYVNLVILNHGKFSSWCDPEWDVNPFNTANGGYLAKPEDYFDDPRALRDFRKLMRYMVSRWGASTRVFSWQLWSEVDLTGSNGSNYRRPEVVDWHRQMGRAIKEMDPYDHLIGTHVCTDYTHQNMDIVALPEIDWAPNDAYHFQADPLYIVDLHRATAAYNNPYNKPVMITEFGGSAYGNSLKHLEDALHAGLWSSTAIPLGGAPMFWWWHLVEEENWYPKFQALNRFMTGEDRRDAELKVSTPEMLVNGAQASDLDVQCLKNRRRALGWLFVRSTFGQTDPKGEARQKNVTVRFAGMDEGEYEVQFWDTQEGKMLERKTIRAVQGLVSAPVPAFARDLAFKVKFLR